MQIRGFPDFLGRFQLVSRISRSPDYHECNFCSAAIKRQYGKIWLFKDQKVSIAVSLFFRFFEVWRHFFHLGSFWPLSLNKVKSCFQLLNPTQTAFCRFYDNNVSLKRTKIIQFTLGSQMYLSNQKIIFSKNWILKKIKKHILCISYS